MTHDITVFRRSKRCPYPLTHRCLWKDWYFCTWLTGTPDCHWYALPAMCMFSFVSPCITVVDPPKLRFKAVNLPPSLVPVQKWVLKSGQQASFSSFMIQTQNQKATTTCRQSYSGTMMFVLTRFWPLQVESHLNRSGITPVIAVNMPKLHQHPPGAVTLVPPKGAVISVCEEEKSCALLMEKVGSNTTYPTNRQQRKQTCIPYA